MVSEYGFVIEDLLDVWNTEVLLAWGLDRNEKLTGYIFCQREEKENVGYIPWPLACFIYFSVFIETEICAQYKYQVIGQRTNIGC